MNMQSIIINPTITIITIQKMMQQDQLLLEWSQAKKTCKKIVDISIQSNLYNFRPQSQTQTQPQSQTITSKQTHQQFISVYDIVYRLCSNPSAEESRVAMVFRDYQDILKNALIVMAREIVQEREVYRLKVLRRVFDAYEDILKRLKHMFAFLDRPYIIKQGKIEQLDKTGIQIIITTLFSQQSHKEYTLIYFKHLSKIRKTRDYTDSRILKDYVQILYKLHLRLSMKKQNKKIRTLYTDFQQKYLAEAKEFYGWQYGKLMDLVPRDYVMEVNGLYNVQRRILEQCFGCCSQSFINKQFSTQFLQQYRQKLSTSQKGLKHILQQHDYTVISTLTNLFKTLSNSIDGFKQPFESFIFQQISNVLTEIRSELLLKKSQQIYILSIHKIIGKNIQLMEIVDVCFEKFQEFVGYFRRGVEKAYEKANLPTPIQQMLAVYVDIRLSRNDHNPQSTKQQTKNIKSIFECLQNKDLFLLKYIQKLSKRILTLPQQTIQNHEYLLFYLKLHSGNKLTQNIEQLLDQYKQNIEQQKQFKQYQLQFNTNKEQDKINKYIRLNYNINLFVFKEAIWPWGEIVEFRVQALPEVFQRGIKCIAGFEEKRGQSRVLRYDFACSRVRWMYYFQKDAENKFSEALFDTNGIQAILLQYIYQHRPQKQSLSLLHTLHPQLKPVQIEQYLQKLCHQPQNILIKSQIQDETFYQFNSEMRTKKRILQYDTPIQAQEQQQQLFQKNEIARERDYAVDANVVKLMKVKKVLRLENIIEEVGKMIKVFTPGVRDIKASVERLLIKEILVRDDKDRNSIKYKS